ncbi:MAG: dihydrodipicolinate synthase family protein [Desulfovibrionaceae bacterium]
MSLPHISPRQRACLDAVRGPVFPVPTPFTQDGEVDWDALERYADWLVRQGAATIMVTVGTSRFALLEPAEMRRVNETVVRAVGGRAYTIVTGPPSGPLRSALGFAEHAAAIGADAMLGVYPERFYDEGAVYAYFETLAEGADVGVMIHLAPIPAGRTGLGPAADYAPALIERLMELPNLVGMKEESNNPWLSYRYNTLCAGRICVIGGSGCMRAHLAASVWGQPAWLVGVGNFAPGVELAFHEALAHGELEAAREIIELEERPFFELAVGLGWHLALKEALDARGLLPAHERAPLRRLHGEDRDRVRAMVTEMTVEG